MELLMRTALIVCFIYLTVHTCESAKINTPRVLLPWFENLNVNFTFEIIEGGCYTWSLSRDDIIDLEPLYEDSWGHCSRAARVSVSKSCAPPGTVIILAEEVNSGEILRGDVDIDLIKYLKVMSTTWKLYLEEAPEAFEVIAYDDQGNTFSTLEGISFTWTIENLGNSVDEDLLVSLVHWSDTDYEAPRGVSELEARGLRSHSVLLYGQAMGECQVTVCLDNTNICTNFRLNVVASVVLTPATAVIAPGDTLRYKVVRARAGRLTIQDISETLYYMKVPETSIALLEDTISLVRGTNLGTTSIILMSGATEVASATLTVSEPHSIRVTLRPSNILIRGEPFIAHCVVLDESGHALTAGDEMLIRLTTDGAADVQLLRGTENGTVTDAVANNAGPLTIYARLYSIAGRTLMRKVEGQVSAVAVDPLEVVPPEVFVAWNDITQDVTLQHRGGGDEPVVWSEKETPNSLFSLTPAGLVTIRGVGHIEVQVQLKKYPHVKAYGKVWSLGAEYLQVSSTGHARVGRPHHLHVALTATHPLTGELFNFHRCNCASFAVSLLEGPEPQNVTAATWVQPVDGACCVVQAAWEARGVCTVRVSRGRAGDTARVHVRAAPALVWPANVAALVGATIPVLAEGEDLSVSSSDPRVVELSVRSGEPPHRHPDVQLFTLKCRRKGDARVSVVSVSEGEQESVEVEAACAPHVTRVRLEPQDAAPGCPKGTKLWLRVGQEVVVVVSLYDAAGRTLLDERGARVSWGVEPHHAGVSVRDGRLLVEHHPEYAPVPVPYTYYQLVTVDEQAVGWSGVLRATVPEATATIQAKVVAPLKVDPLTVNLAWEGETITNIAQVSGGSGRYAVESAGAGASETGADGAPGVSGTVAEGALGASVPGPGTYDLVVADLCVSERQIVEVHIEEVLSVEVSTSRAICVGGCVPVAAIVRGVSHRQLRASRAPEWRVAGDVRVQDAQVCGVQEGTGRVRAALGGVWSPEVEILVFPPLQIIPERARVPPGARLQLRHAGGPPPHLASLHYHALSGGNFVEVSPSGAVHGLALGSARVRLVATDINAVEMASAESEVEVVPISALRVRAATQTLLVGCPSPVWVEAAGLSPAALGALHPPPRVTFSVRDPRAARLYTTHADDMLERSVAEGLSVRVVPLKPGLITIDVRVRNMGQVAETRSWDSTIEVLSIADVAASVEGAPMEFPQARLAVAPGATVRLRSKPRSSWQAISEGAFEVSGGGELRALAPGHGVLVAALRDDRNNVYRESIVHVEVSLPHYCTAEPAGELDGPALAVRVVLRSAAGRELLAPDANVSVAGSHAHLAQTRRQQDSALGPELVFPGLEPAGALMTFHSSASGVTVSDQVWVAGPDPRADRITVTGGWAVCLEGTEWRAPGGVQLYAGAGVTLALLAADAPAPVRHRLHAPAPAPTAVLHQLPLHKMEFLPGEWPAALVPLSLQPAGAGAGAGDAGGGAGPLLCTEEQKYALEGIEPVLPFTCRTKPPHTAEPVLDIPSGQLGCRINPAPPFTDASQAELCAEWGVYRTCTTVTLVPPIRVSHNTLSLADPSPIFTITGHPLALKGVKITTSPGLKIEKHVKDLEINVLVKSETSVCGFGWVVVTSRVTAQAVRVEVDRRCDVTCGTLLGALVSLLAPYLSTLVTIVAVAAGFLFIQSKLQARSGRLVLPEPAQTVLLTTPPRRTSSRSPYAPGPAPPPPPPAAPVYGDASVLPDNSFSPNGSIHSRFL